MHFSEYFPGRRGIVARVARGARVWVWALIVILMLTALPGAFAQQATEAPPTVTEEITAEPTTAATTASDEEATAVFTQPAATLPAALTPNTLPEYVLTAESDVIYPTALASYFQFDQPKGTFISAELTLSQDGWSGETISVDYADIADEVDGVTLFTYIWDIRPNDPPQLFEDITLTWRFITQDGDTETFVHTLLYADPRVTWQTITADNGLVELAFPSDRASSARAADLDASYALLQTSTGQLNFTPTLRLVFYDGSPSANPCQTRSSGESISSGLEIFIELPCDPNDVFDLFYTPSGYTLIELPTMTAAAVGGESVEHTVVGMLFDQFYDRLWGNSGATVPAWFREGLRHFYTSGPKLSEYETARAASRAGGALRNMENVPQESARRTQWSAQSYGMVLYMAEQLGVDGLFSLASSLSAENALADAYAEATDSTLSGLISAWSSWLFTPQAVSAYGYSPYLPTTATPTMTMTFTPTITRTFTPSRTPTITPSVTGILSPTPRPPTIVPPTPTPSITSRPAGSIPNPITTPTAAPETAAADDDEGRRTVTLLIGVGLMATGILIAVAALFLRNQSTNQGTQ